MVAHDWCVNSTNRCIFLNKQKTQPSTIMITSQLNDKLKEQATWWKKERYLWKNKSHMWFTTT